MYANTRRKHISQHTNVKPTTQREHEASTFSWEDLSTVLLVETQSAARSSAIHSSSTRTHMVNIKAFPKLTITSRSGRLTVAILSWSELSIYLSREGGSQSAGVDTPTRHDTSRCCNTSNCSNSPHCPNTSNRAWVATNRADGHSNLPEQEVMILHRERLRDVDGNRDTDGTGDIHGDRHRHRLADAERHRNTVQYSVVDLLVDGHWVVHLVRHGDRHGVGPGLRVVGFVVGHVDRHVDRHVHRHGHREGTVLHDRLHRLVAGTETKTRHHLQKRARKTSGIYWQFTHSRITERISICAWQLSEENNIYLQLSLIML